MTSSSPDRRKTRGNIALVFGVGLVVMALGLGLLTRISSFNRVSQRKMQVTRSVVVNNSGAEIMLVAYRNAEVKYIEGVSGCSTAVPFLQALKSGSGCPILIKVWNSADVLDPGVLVDEAIGQPVYSFPRGHFCAISQFSSSCATGNQEVVDADVSDVPRGGPPGTKVLHYQFFLTAVVPKKGIAQFNAKYSGADGKVSSFSFSIRSSFRNAAHIEVDGRVTQENPDPLSQCLGTPWTLLQVFDLLTTSCLKFQQLGGGTGLAFYQNRYFGFRPADGQVVDLLTASNGSPSYLVDEDGKLNGTVVFPPYNKAMLLNKDDISTIATQIYYVAFGGPGAHIGMLDPANLSKNIELCPLGALGWGQSYEGILAGGESDPLVPLAGGDPLKSRLAKFYLKTSGGDLLTAVVLGKSNAGPPYVCHVFKDKLIQQVEYKRTYGFDRTEIAKPYYIF